MTAVRRAIFAWIGFTVGGAAIGTLYVTVTSPHAVAVRLPRVYVSDGCLYSKHAFTVASDNLDHLIPIPISLSPRMCKVAIDALRAESMLLYLAPQDWLCSRLVSESYTWIEEKVGSRDTPRFFGPGSADRGLGLSPHVAMEFGVTELYSASLADFSIVKITDLDK